MANTPKLNLPLNDNWTTAEVKDWAVSINDANTNSAFKIIDDFAATVDTKVDGKEAVANKTTTLSSESTNTQYPAAKTVYDFVMANRALPENVATEAEMTAKLSSGNIGKVYRFVGETTSTYINGDLYVVEEE